MQTRGTMPTAYDGAKKTVTGRVTMRPTPKAAPKPSKGGKGGRCK